MLARGQVQAGDKEHVLQAVKAVGGEIRVKLGESLGSIHKLDYPFRQVTTPSLEAFQAYTQGLEQLFKGSNPAAERFFQRATELDPNFAAAYSGLGSANWNMGDMERYAEYSKKAFSLVGQAASEGAAGDFWQLLFCDWAVGQIHRHLSALRKHLSPRWGAIWRPVKPLHLDWSMG